MHKITFVVEFQDGHNPEIGPSTQILGGRLCGFSYSDLIAENGREPIGIDAVIQKIDEYAALWALVDSDFDYGWCKPKAEALKAEIKSILAGEVAQ